MSNDLYLRKDKELKCPTTCICVKTMGGIAQWVGRLTRNRLMPVSPEPHQRASVVSLSKKVYPYCLVLVGPRNGFERDLDKQNVSVSQSNQNRLV